MDLGKLGLARDTERVTDGTGIVHERTVEFGDTVVAVAGIGSMVILRPKREVGPIVVGVVFVLMGFTLARLSGVPGTLLMLTGIALVIWGMMRPLDVMLSIGTSDGRRLALVSKDPGFLAEILSFIRGKIDQDDLRTATINISARRIDGGIAVGENARAAGRAGAINEGGVA